jgi:hypothetical protein
VDISCFSSFLDVVNARVQIRSGRVGATLPVKSISPKTETSPFSNVSHPSWSSDADVPTGSAFKRSLSFDQHQYCGALDYERSFNLSSGDLSNIEDPSSFSLIPSDPSLSDTLSTSDVSYTSSVTAYSTDSDHHTHFSPSSSINSRSESVQIDYRRVSNRIDFDAQSFRASRYSSSGSSASWRSRSRSVSPSSDLEDFEISSPEDSYQSTQETEFQPGTSVETIRPVLSRPLLATEELSEFLHFDSTSDQRCSAALSSDVINTPYNSVDSAFSDKLMDESETIDHVGKVGESNGDGIFDWTAEVVEGGDGRHRNQDRSSTGGDDRHEEVNDRGYTDRQIPRNIGGGSGSGNGGRDSDDDDPRKDGRGLNFSVTSLFLDSDEEEDDDNDNYHTTDDFGPSQPVTPLHRPGDVLTSDSDDVPLARSIPNALQAQLTIRKEVRHENAQRKQEKALRVGQASKARHPEQPNRVDTSHRPPESQQSASPRMPPTSPSSSSPSVNVDHLTRKLIGLKTNCGTPVTSTMQSLRHMHSSSDLAAQAVNGERSINPKRSLRQLRGQESAPPTPVRSDLIPRNAASSSRSRAASTDDRRTGRSKTKSPNQYSTGDEFGRRGRPLENRTIASHTEDSRSMPPLPPYELVAKLKTEPLWQQRIFIGDLQRFSLIEVGNSTSAQDVVDILEGQGELQGNGWMLFELAQDFGMGIYLVSLSFLSFSELRM